MNPAKSQPPKPVIAVQHGASEKGIAKTPALSSGGRESALTLSEGPMGVKPRSHNGMPVITKEEYLALYNGQSDEKTVRTFNFQGYMEAKDGTLCYKDVIATNGLLGGIHVGIDGMKSYHSCDGAKGPEDISEYVLFISVPARIQGERRVVCDGDSISLETEYIENAGHGEDGRAHMGGIRDQENLVAVRLSAKPRKDAGAREKVFTLAMAVNNYVLAGHPLEHLKTFIYEVEDILEDPVATRARWDALIKKLKA